MGEKELVIGYDGKKTGVLYCSFGAPQAAISEETADEVILRRHPETREVVGFTRSLQQPEAGGRASAHVLIYWGLTRGESPAFEDT